MRFRFEAVPVAGGIVLLGILGVLFWAVAHAVRLPYPSTEQRASNRNIGEIVGAREVGQTFESIRPFLSGVGFQMATYGGRENDRDVIFELREDVRDREPLRAVAVNARAFGDHRMHVFSFEPITDSAGRTYYASLRSPAAEPGNAVTVDYHSENPYQKGTASALVVLPAAREDLDTTDGTIKTRADAAFVVIHRVTLWEFLRLVAKERVAASLGWLRDHPRDASRLGQFVGVSALVSLVSLAFRGRVARFLARPGVFPVAAAVVILAGLTLRMQFVERLPYTNDEGSYLLDARTVLEGRLPGGDGLAKAPVVVGAFALGMTAVGTTLTAARLVSVGAGLATALPLYVLGRFAGGRLAGGIAAALWLLASGPALFNAYGHTQSVQMLIATSALAVLVWGLPRERRWWLFLSGVLLGVGLAARKSTLAVGLPVLFLLVTQAASWPERARRLVMTGAGFALSAALLFFFAHTLYGLPGALYATGFDLARTSFEQLSDRGDLYATYSVKGILPFFREMLPLIFLSLVALGRGVERSLERFGGIASRLAWAVPLLLVWRGGEFLQRYEEDIHLAHGVWPFWIAMGVALALLAVLPRVGEARGGRDATGGRFPLLLPVVWFAGVGIFYAFWIKFHANYILEFLPALVLAAAAGARWLTRAFARPRAIVVLLGALLFWGSMSATLSGYASAHTGTFHWSSLTEAAAYLKEHADKTDLVLTGAVAIPYLSGHRVPYDVAHPTWYGYGFIEPELRQVFMASADQMVEAAVTDVRWFVGERLTTFSYLNEYPDIARVIETSFEEVAEIENPSNTITIYRRVRD